MPASRCKVDGTASNPTTRNQSNRHDAWKRAPHRTRIHSAARSLSGTRTCNMASLARSLFRAVLQHKGKVAVVAAAVVAVAVHSTHASSATDSQHSGAVVAVRRGRRRCRECRSQPLTSASSPCRWRHHTPHSRRVSGSRAWAISSVRVGRPSPCCCRRCRRCGSCRCRCAMPRSSTRSGPSVREPPRSRGLSALTRRCSYV